MDTDERAKHRSLLIDLCERGVVPVENWRDRDSSGAQTQLGTALALLKAGCDYRIAANPQQTATTIWIEISWPAFQAFEYGRENRDNWEEELFYIPTDARLGNAAGRDWY